MATIKPDYKREIGILRRLEALRGKLLRDPRATERYWNADDWGSSSGAGDARRWIEGELGKWLHEQITTPMKKASKKGGRE